MDWLGGSMAYAAVQATIGTVWRKCIRDADDSLSCAKEQAAFRLQALRKVFHCAYLGREIEIDHHIAAEYDVECTELVHIIQQIECFKTHHAAQAVVEAPQVAVRCVLFN